MGTAGITKDQLPAARTWPFSQRAKLACVVGIVLGCASFVAALQFDPQRAWTNYLINYFYWMGLSLLGVFFVALQHITGSTWSTGLRRVAEAMASFMPLAVLLFFGVVAGASVLYEWMDPHVVAHSHFLPKKTGWLNIEFFTLRNLSFLVLWTLAAWMMIRNSIAQDETGDLNLSKRNVKLAGCFILFFAITFTLASFDLLMSLEAEWFSTIWGIYCFGGAFYSFLAMLIVVAGALYKRGYFTGYLDPGTHFFDLGKLLLAFCVFWAYIGFSQYMLIWYADLPEETFFFLRRQEGAWMTVTWVLMITKFAIPFVYLLPQATKKKVGLLMPVALWVLVTHYIDLCWVVTPKFAAGPTFGWVEVGMFGGFAALFFACVRLFLSKVPVIAKGDPGLMESVTFHQ